MLHRALPNWLAANPTAEVVALLGAAREPDEARAIASALRVALRSVGP